MSDFDEIMQAAGLGELAEEMNKALQPAPAKPMVAKHDGLSYAGDEGSISRYAFFVNGKRVFDVIADNAAVLDTKTHPKFGAVTTHALFIVKPGETVGITTNGLAARYTHDGSTHIDGQSVFGYVAPRAARFITDLYV